MFGELGNSDIHDNEPNYGFDEFYNGESNYPSDNDRLASSQDDDFWDAGSYDSTMQNAQPQNNAQQNVQRQNVQPQQGFDGQNAGQQYAGNMQNAGGNAAGQAQKKSSGIVYVLLLLLLLVAAAGMFFYKKNMTSGQDTAAEQSMGDYFYDKATAESAENPASSGESTVTVDVNLTEPAQPAQDTAALPEKPAQAADTDKQEQQADASAEQDKKLTPLEKAKLKKKADEQKEAQSALARSVIVPVSAGGRPDPFVPYMQKDALVQQSKFELIAPPSVIPELDPVVDELVQTKISGIMFDQARPSAIVNFAGEDHLVHKGDVVKGYNVVNITKNSVVIKYKNNIYQATVGQTLDDGVNLNPVSGLSNQFGGAYNKSAGNVIQFNEQN